MTSLAVLEVVLAHEGYVLRPAEARDDSFLRSVFALARLDAPLLATWPADQRAVFLEQQYRFQDRHYREAYAGADFLVVERAGDRIGRMILERGPTVWQIVDIALLPDVRGRGTGTTLLRSLQDAARSAGASISLHVEHGNPARRLYERLGFMAGEDIGSHLAMAWTPVS